MTRMTLKQKLTATPLIKIRLIALFIVVTGLTINAIAFLAELNGEMSVSDGFYNMVYLSIISVLPILFMLDRALYRRWIKNEALIITPLSQDFAKAYLKDRVSFDPKRAMFIPCVIFSGVFLYELGFLIGEGYFLMWIPSVFILTSIVIYLISLLKKKDSMDKTVYISEFGMIYLGDLVLWNDRLSYFTYIAELRIIDDLIKGSNLYLKIDFYGVTGSRFVDYYVSIPEHQAKDLDDIIKRILLVNQKNKDLVSKKRH